MISGEWYGNIMPRLLWCWLNWKKWAEYEEKSFCFSRINHRFLSFATGKMCPILADWSIDTLWIFYCRSSRCLQYAPVSIEWIQSDRFESKNEFVFFSSSVFRFGIDNLGWTIANGTSFSLYRMAGTGRAESWRRFYWFHRSSTQDERRLRSRRADCCTLFCR